MSLTTQVPRLVKSHEVRRLHRSLNFSVPALLPLAGVFAGRYGFLVLVIFAANYWL